MSPLPVPPRFHRSDPLTSGQAALDHRVSGKLGRDQEIALRLVREHPGSTAPELGAYLGGGEAGRQRVGRRLSELATGTCRECGARAVVRREAWMAGWKCMDRKGGCGMVFTDPDPSFMEDPPLVYQEGSRDGCALWWPVRRETGAQGRLFDVPERRVWD